MDQKGITLLELVLAFTVLGVVLLGGSILNFSLMSNARRAQTEVETQANLAAVLRDMEIHLRDAQVDTSLDASAKICSENASTSRSQTSPCVYPNYAQKTIDLRIKNSVTPNPEIIKYRYKVETADGKIVKSLSREKCTPTCSGYKVLAYGLEPYADADINMDGQVDATELNQRDTCLTALNNTTWGKTPCFDSPGGIDPVFKVSSDNKKIVIAFKAGKAGVNYKQGTTDKINAPGVVKTIALFES